MILDFDFRDYDSWDACCYFGANCDNCFAYCPEKGNFTHCKFILNLAKHTEWENMN